jgi:putative endonuclease
MRRSRPPEAGPPPAEKPLTKMPCVYILKSQVISKIYVGSSRESSAVIRLNSHNAGRVRSTKAGRPWAVVFTEACENYTLARQRENFLKSGVGRKWIKETLS